MLAAQGARPTISRTHAYKHTRTICSYLPRNRLVGTLPSSLGDLAVAYDAFELFFSGNQLRGTIPESLARYNTSALSLTFTENNFSGAVPESLVLSTSLQNLSLRGNRITSISNKIFESENLALLYERASARATHALSIKLAIQTLTDDDDDGVLIDSWADEIVTWLPTETSYSSYPRASRPIVSCTTCACREPTHDSPLVCVISFSTSGEISRDISGTKARGTWSPTIKNCKGFKTLVFSSTQVSGQLLPELFSFVNLTTLDAAGSNLSGSIPTEIGDARSLMQMYDT